MKKGIWVDLKLSDYWVYILYMWVEVTILKGDGRVVGNHKSALTEDEKTGLNIAWNIESIGTEVIDCLVHSICL